MKWWWRSRRRCRWVVLAVLIGAVLIRPGAASADVIPQGQKPVDYCFEVANVGDYPGYVVLAYELPSNPNVAATFHTIADASCTAASFPTTLYAMRQADYSPDVLPTDRAAQRSFLASDPRVIRGDATTQLSPVRFVDQSDSRAAITETYRIASLTDSTLTMERISSPSDAVASTTNRAITFAWFALLPLAALIAIGAVLLLRRRQGT